MAANGEKDELSLCRSPKRRVDGTPCARLYASRTWVREVLFRVAFQLSYRSIGSDPNYPKTTNRTRRSNNLHLPAVNACDTPPLFSQTWTRMLHDEKARWKHMDEDDELVGLYVCSEPINPPEEWTSFRCGRGKAGNMGKF